MDELFFCTCVVFKHEAHVSDDPPRIGRFFLFNFVRIGANHLTQQLVGMLETALRLQSLQYLLNLFDLRH